MIVKLLTEHHLEFLSLKRGYRGSSESTLVKMSNCWKSHALAQFYFQDGIVPIPPKTMFQTYVNSYPGMFNCDDSSILQFVHRTGGNVI